MNDPTLCYLIGWVLGNVIGTLIVVYFSDIGDFDEDDHQWP